MWSRENARSWGRGALFLRSDQRRTAPRSAITFPRELNAAIESWRTFRPERPKRATATVELIACGLAATP